MKKYCKRCVFYISKSRALGIDKKGYLKHVCGATLREFTNELGIKEYVKYGDYQQCTECGAVLKDPRKLVLKECHIKNKKFRCREFKVKLIWMLFFSISRLITNIKTRRAESIRNRKKK